jgi:hypothetical protein
VLTALLYTGQTKEIKSEEVEEEKKNDFCTPSP